MSAGSIVSSVIVSDLPQRDGRRWVTERHTDQAGIRHDVTYLADAHADAAAAMAARAATIMAGLVQAEIAANVAAIQALGSPAVLTLVYSDTAANQAAAWVAYQTATGVPLVMLSDWLATVSDAELQTASHLSPGAVTALRATRLGPIAAAASQIRNMVG